MENIKKHIIYDYRKDIINIIENGSTQDFIDFAKRYNIFQENGTQFYKIICDKIKARLDTEGLSYEIVRPE